MMSWGHQNVVLNMILPVIVIIKSITLSCLIGNLHLAQKYVPIFVQEHYLFPEAKSIVYCRKEADNFQGQISQYIFVLNGGFQGFWSFKCLSHYSKFKIENIRVIYSSIRNWGLISSVTYWDQSSASEDICWIIITAAASEPEGNERGSSLTSRRLHYRGLRSLFLRSTRNCGYAQLEDLGCAVVCRNELWLWSNGKI